MKLSGQKANAYFRDPEVCRTGVLIFGPDPMRVALKRQEIIKALVGTKGEEEMRLNRLSSGELKKDPSKLVDTMKAKSFFPGSRVLFVEDASNNLTKTIKEAFGEWQEGDAQLVITAGQLRATSTLRKLFETHSNAYAIAVYSDPPSEHDVQRAIKQVGIQNIPDNSFQALFSLSRVLEPGDFEQTLEKLFLFKLNDKTPLTPEEINSCAPLSNEAAIEDVLNCVCEGHSDRIGPIMGQLLSQGIKPVALSIGATRHFKLLFTIATDAGGLVSGATRLRPPVYGLRKDRLLKHANIWGVVKLKQAMEMLIDLDLKLRSGGQLSPSAALVERTMIRLAIMAQR